MDEQTELLNKIILLANRLKGQAESTLEVMERNPGQDFSEFWVPAHSGIFHELNDVHAQVIWMRYRIAKEAKNGD